MENWEMERLKFYGNKADNKLLIPLNKLLTPVEFKEWQELSIKFENENVYNTWKNNNTNNI